MGFGIQALDISLFYLHSGSGNIRGMCGFVQILRDDMSVVQSVKTLSNEVCTTIGYAIFLPKLLNLYCLLFGMSCMIMCCSLSDDIFDS